MKQQKGNDLIFLLIVAVITAVLWVGFEAFRTFRRVPAPTGVEQLLQPLDPTLKTRVLDTLQGRSL